MQKYKTILVVTYGRSGSTLLQGILNNIDGYLVRGENHNLFHGFFTAYAALQKTIEKRPEKGIKPSQAWYGAKHYDLDDFLGNLRITACNLLLAGEQARCLGFKEIRYSNMTGDPKDLTDYLDFLQELFEAPCIIFNTRNLADTVKSGFWRNRDPKLLTPLLQELENIVLAYGKERNNFFHIDYDDMASHTPKIEALFDFLGESYDKDQVEAVISIEHSSVTAKLPQHEKKEGVIKRLCARVLRPK